MLIARQKKEESIAEYLLYMWQVEDMLRSLDLDIDRVQPVLVDPVYPALEQRKEARDWYEGLIMMMKSEGVQKEGHLQVNKNVIIELTDLHLRLLKDPKESEYIGIYYHTLPHIVALRAKGAGKDIPELETCFTALYGYLLLKLRKKEISAGTEAAIAQISKLLRLLSVKYKMLDKENENSF